MLDLNSFEQLAMTIKKRGKLESDNVLFQDGTEKKGLDKYTYGKATLFIWYADYAGNPYPSVEIQYQKSKRKRVSVGLIVRSDPTITPQNGVYGRLDINYHNYCPHYWDNFDIETVASEFIEDLTAHQFIDRLLER